MARRLALHLLKVGSCRHCERVALRGGRLKTIEFPALAALIMHPEHGPILFDTGYAAHFMHATTPFPERLYRWLIPVALPAGQGLAAQLQRFGLTLADITLCVISHFHADHIAGLRDLPNASFICSAAGLTQMANASRLRGLIQGLLPALLPDDFESRTHFIEHLPKVALPVPWRALADGADLLGDRSLIALPLPGHAPGQLGLLLHDEDGREVFLCADACWSRAALQELRMPSIITRPLMHDWRAYRQTILTLNALARQHAELAILPSHCNHSLAAYQPSWWQQ